jgi:hypothetical protein
VRDHLHLYRREAAAQRLAFTAFIYSLAFFCLFAVRLIVG